MNRYKICHGRVTGARRLRCSRFRAATFHRGAPPRARARARRPLVSTPAVAYVSRQIARGRAARLLVAAPRAAKRNADP